MDNNNNNFDPVTGAPINNDDAPKFDPITGAPINSDDAPKFDPMTGAPINDMAQPEEPIVSLQATPKKKSKIPVIAGCAVGGIAVAGIAAACVIKFVPSVNNWFNLKTKEPDEYFADAESKYFEDNAKKIGEQFKISSDVYSNILESVSSASDVTELKLPEQACTITVGASMDAEAIIDLANAVSSLSGKEVLDTSGESAASAIQLLSAFKSIELSSDIKSNGNGLFSTTAKIGLNETDIVDADVIVDIENLSIYVAVPTISDKYIKYTVTQEQLDSLKSQMESSMKSDDMQKMTDAVGQASTMIEKMSENMEDIIKTYSKIIVDGIKDVDIKENEEIEICDEKFNVTEMETKVTSKDVNKIAENILEEAKDDKTIIDIAESAGVNEDEYKKALESAIDSIKDNDSDSDESMTVTSWTDSKGNVLGHKFKIEDTEMGYAAIENNDNSYASIWLTADSSEFTANLTANGKDKEEGKIVINYKSDENDIDTNINIDFSDYKVVNEEKGLVNFNSTITTDFKGLEDFCITFKNDCEDNSQKSTLGLKYKDKECMSLSVGAATSDNCKIDIPSNVLEFTGDETNMSNISKEYLLSVNLVAIKDNLKKAIDNTLVNQYIDQFAASSGLDTMNGSQTEEQASSFFNSLGGSSSDDDYYGYITDDYSTDDYSGYDFSDNELDDYTYSDDDSASDTIDYSSLDLSEYLN